MRYETINLQKHYLSLKREVTLTAYCPSNSPEIDINRKREAILILPGGGYAMVSDREAEIVALRFLGFDFACFVLSYSIFPNTHYPYPLIEGYAALDFIKKHADEFHINAEKIYVMGFSAGGHFACSLAVYQNTDLPKKLLSQDVDIKIKGCILGYPVITMSPDSTHLRTWKNIVEIDDNKYQNFYCIDKHIDNSFPRTFVFSFEQDPYVPISNTLILIDKLKKNNVEVESIIYQGKIHGSSLADQSVYPDSSEMLKIAKTSKTWYLKAIDFIRKESK